MRRLLSRHGILVLIGLWALGAALSIDRGEAAQSGSGDDVHAAVATSEGHGGAGGDTVQAENDARAEGAGAHGGEAAAHGEGAATAHGEGAAAHGEGDAAHGEGDAAHGEGEQHFHLPSVLDLIIRGIPGGKESEVGHGLYMFAPTIFGILIAIMLAVVVRGATRNLTLVPGRLQNFLEIVIGGLNDFIIGVLGPEGRRFVPFLGTLFIYILCMNWLGLIPLMMAPTSRIHMTAGLAILVFLFVQYTALRMNGFGGYVKHLAGDPQDGLGWALVPMMLPLHIIGELAKPFSLAIRLFGNIFGEETLIAVFVVLGAGVLAFIPVLPIGVPFHVPFVFLSLLLSTIQALVFMLLSTIYFAMILPHGDHEH